MDKKFDTLFIKKIFLNYLIDVYKLEHILINYYYYLI